MANIAPAKIPAQPKVSTRELARRASRDALINAVSDIMIENDSLDFPLTEVAARTGMSATLVQYHFGSKEGLLMAVVEKQTANAARDLEELIAADFPAAYKLKMHVRGVVKAYMRFPFTNRLVHHLIQISDEEQASHLSDIFIKPIADFHRKLLLQGEAEGAFRPIDPMHFYHLLIGSCEHVVAYRRALSRVFGPDGTDDQRRQQYAETVFSVILNGITAK